MRNALSFAMVSLVAAGCGSLPTASTPAPKTTEFDGRTWTYSGLFIPDTDHLFCRGDVYCDPRDPDVRLIDLERETAEGGSIKHLQRRTSQGKWVDHGRSEHHYHDGSGYIEYDDGVPHGEQVEYYPNGQKRLHRNWVHGEMGSGKVWKEDGTLDQ